MKYENNGNGLVLDEEYDDADGVYMPLGDGDDDGDFSSDGVYMRTVMVTMIFSGDGVYMPQQSETARPRACHSLCTAFTLLYTHRHTAHTACQPLHTATLHTAHCNYTLQLHTVYMRTLHT